MPYEIFLSYKREDAMLRDQIMRILQDNLGYEGKVFVDVAMAAGPGWRAQVQEALSQRDLKPYVLLLATRNAADDPGGITAELTLAEEHQLEVIPVQFDPGAVRALLGNERRQYIEVAWDGTTCSEEAKLEKLLNRSLNRRTELLLMRHREETHAWVQQRLPNTSFWTGLVSRYFPVAESVALLGPAGAGKSVLVAHHLQQLLDQDPSVYPVLVTPDRVKLGMSVLAGDLGARTVDDLAEHLHALSVNHNQRVLFVVDGLDQIAIPGDSKRDQLSDALNLLASAGRLIVTCREQVWAASFANRVVVHASPSVLSLTKGQVSAVLHRHEHLRGKLDNRLLSIPFFLNIVDRKAASWADLPATDVGFLTRVLDAAVESAALQSEASRHEKLALLQSLAALQLRHLEFEVDHSELRTHSHLPNDRFDVAVRELVDEEVLSTSATSLKVRLAHDLLDAFSAGRLIVRAPDPGAEYASVCHRSERDSAWSVLSMAILIADERRDHETVRRFFQSLLDLLDRKHAGSAEIARAWAATYVIQERLATLLELVLTVLGGQAIADVRHPGSDNQQLSRMDPPTRLTAAAASSVASAFMAWKPGEAPVSDADRVVPVLAQALHKWPYRARLIDGLARFRTDSALRVIVEFGEYQLLVRDDLDCLQYIAQALAGRDQPATRELLMRILGDEELNPIVRRRAHESMATIDDTYQIPERDEVEIEHGLRIEWAGATGYSDWKVVEEYAEYVTRQAEQGRRFSAATCGALVKALHHSQVAVHEAVAEALGVFPDAAARDALLDELLKPVVPTRVREAAVRSLGRQLESIDGSDERQAHRLLLLRAARNADHDGALAIAGRLTDLAVQHSRLSTDWLCDAEAIEVVPPGEPGAALRTVVDVVEEASDVDMVDQAVARVMARTEARDVGPDLETKYRLTAAARTQDGGIYVRAVRTTWTVGRAFHEVMAGAPEQLRHADDGSWLLPRPLGPVVVPGLLSSHVIVLTVDDQVLMAKRSPDARYAPSRWSASFEEQVTSMDLGPDADCLSFAACRGLQEEFGCHAEPDDAVVLTMILETQSLNVSAVVLLRPKLTANEIMESWSVEPGPQDKSEAADIRFLPVGALSTDRASNALSGDFELWHPSTRIRLAAFARWSRWTQPDQPGATRT